MDASNLTALIVAVIGAVALIAAAVIGRPLVVPPPPPGVASISRRTVVGAVAGIVLIASVSYLAWSMTRMSVEIVYPTDGGIVDITEDIAGVSRRLPDGSTLWIVVWAAVDRKYFPHGSPVTVDANGRWSSPGVSIGSSADGGKDFEILALSVDEAGLGALQEYILRTDRSGMDELPTGFMTLDRVAVRRRR